MFHISYFTLLYPLITKLLQVLSGLVRVTEMRLVLFEATGLNCNSCFLEGYK